MSAVLSVQFRRGGIWHALRDEADARTACGRVVRAQQRRQPMWDWATHRAAERCVHCDRSLDREEATGVTATERKPRLFARRCASCIFRPGNLMSLREGRLADVVAANRATGSMLTCHETLDEAPEGRAMCRGYWDAYAATSSVPQVMERIYGPDWFEEVEP